jgi:hypothetical protein
MKNHRSLEANLHAAKTAIHEMIRFWHQWKEATSSREKTEAIAGYAAAYTNCKVYIENYLKHFDLPEQKFSVKLTQDIRKIFKELDVIEKASDKKLYQAVQDIEKLALDAA